MADLNPQIKSVSVGIKELRKVTIYPLSIADQTKTTEAIAELVAMAAGGSFADMKDNEVVNIVIKAIRENLTSILVYLTDSDEEITLEELTNMQFSEIADIVFEVNYEELIKNLKDLSEKVKQLLVKNQSLPEGSLPKSSKKPVTN